MIRNKGVHDVVLEGTLMFAYIGRYNWFDSDLIGDNVVFMADDEGVMNRCLFGGCGTMKGDTSD